MQWRGLRAARIFDSMPEVIRQLPFLIAVFSISWWLCPEDAFADALDELEFMDALLFAGSCIMFLIGCLTSYVLALESIPTD